MIRTQVEFEDGFIEVHFAFSVDEDVAICGCDLHGDDFCNREHGSYGTATPSKHKGVNCSDCLRLVKECKPIRLWKIEKENHV